MAQLHYLGGTFTIRYDASSISVRQTGAAAGSSYFVLVAPGGERWGVGLTWTVTVGTGNASIIASAHPGARPPNW